MKKLTTLCLALFFASCGGEPQDGLGDVDLAARGAAPIGIGDAFIGAWRLTSGTMSANCGGYSPEDSVRGSSVVWSRGGTPDLVANGAGGFCSLTASVTGSTASAAAGQGCIASDGAYGFYTISRTGYTFTLSADAQTAEESSAGTVEFSEGGVASMACAYLGTAAYQKVSEGTATTRIAQIQR